MTAQKKKTKALDYDSSADRILSYSHKQDVEFLNSQIALFTNGVNRSDTEANSTDRGLASQLILITTVLITANIVVFSNGELMKSLSLDQIFISILGSNMLVLSLFFGIAYYARIKKFHIKWSDARADIANGIGLKSTLTRRQIDQLVKEKTRNLSPQIRSFYLILQIFFLAFALLTYLALTTSLLLGIQFEDVPSLLSS